MANYTVNYTHRLPPVKWVLRHWNKKLARLAKRLSKARKKQRIEL